MMHNKHLYVFLIVFLCMVGCSTLQVSEEATSTRVNLDRFKTYSFNLVTHNEDTLITSSPANVNYVTGALSKQLNLKGLSQVAQDGDLVINIHAVIEEKIQTRETDIRTDAPRYIGQRRYTWKVDTVEIGRYEVATFEIELIDDNVKEVIWSGVVEGILPSKESRKKKVIGESVERLLENL